MRKLPLLVPASLIFAVCCLFYMHSSKAQSNSAPSNPAAEKPELFSKQTVGLKQVAQTIKNYKSAGVAFERRDLFHTTNRKVSSDTQLREIVGDGVTFNLDKAAVQRLLRENAEFLTLPLPDGRGGTLELELAKIDIFAAGFSVKTSNPNREPVAGNLGIHYRGTVKGAERSLAAVSIFKNEVMGFYSTDADGNSVLGRLGGNNPGDRHILYAEKDLKISSNFYCGTKDDGVRLPASFLHEPEEIAVRCVRIYLEANYDLFVNKGSVAAVTAYLTGIFNQSAALFANEGTPVSISEIFVWNSPSPYNAPTAGEVLNQFKSFRTGFNGDLAHLVTLDREFGGVAYVNSLCNQNLSYAVSDINDTFENVPAYSFSVYVFTHETGHNLGSPHTHTCAWNGNNTAIDSCGPMAGFPYEGTCSDAPLPPPNGGTIMSYCHRNVGINFSLGFGEQPRNLIVNRYNAAAACLSDCGSECIITTSPSISPMMSAAGESGSFNIFTGNNCTWTATIEAPSLAETLSPLKNEFSFVPSPDAPNQKSSPEAQAAPEAIFQNSARIDINDRTSNANPPGTSTFYPSTMNVSGVAGTLRRARVTIYGLNHTSPDDIDILLVCPTGQRTILMSDVGGDADLVNVDLTFDDFGAVLPDEGQILPGIYKPTNFSGNPFTEAGNKDIFPLPAPPQTIHNASFSEFYGRNPNGTWEMFVVDDENGNSGSIIEGWTLELQTTGGGGSWIVVGGGSSGTGNGTINYLTAANYLRLPRTGKIRVNNQIHTVRQAGRPFGVNLFDFEGDGKADIAVFRPSSGHWYINNSSNNPLTAVQFGANGDLPAPADFDGDGKTDICVFRPASGVWYRFYFGTNLFSSFQFGQNGDLPVPSDYDGDHSADIALYRPSDGTWYRIKSNTQEFVAFQFGTPEDKPIIGDFDGDATADTTVFRPSNGTWYRINSSNGAFTAIQFGINGDIPAAADYDGDGKTDLAVYRPSNGTWYRINSENGAFAGAQFGIAEDKPAPADYDGDGKADIAVFRPSSGIWYLLRSGAGFAGQQFGTSGDIPIAGAFAR